MADIKTGGAVATPQCPFYLGEGGGIECTSVSKKGGVESVTCFSRFTVGSYKEQNQQTKNNEPYNPINFSSKLFAICYWNLRYFRTLTALLRHIHRQEPITRSLHTNCTLESTLSRIFLFLELRYVGVL